MKVNEAVVVTETLRVIPPGIALTWGSRAVIYLVVEITVTTSGPTYDCITYWSDTGTISQESQSLSVGDVSNILRNPKFTFAYSVDELREKLGYTVSPETAADDEEDLR